MHRSRAPSIAPGTFFVVQSWAGCITSMPGFALRQAQGLFYANVLDEEVAAPDASRKYFRWNSLIGRSSKQAYGYARGSASAKRYRLKPNAASKNRCLKACMFHVFCASFVDIVEVREKPPVQVFHFLVILKEFRIEFAKFAQYFCFVHAEQFAPAAHDFAVDD